MKPCSPLASEKLKKAIRAFSDLIEQFPERSRRELLQEIGLQFDLSPLECEFLNNRLARDDDCRPQ